MDPFPTVRDLSESPDSTGEGHLWVLEELEGIPLRFSLQADGQLVFGDETRRLRPDDVEPALTPAIESIQTHFRRDAFRTAVEDVAAVTFYGVATCQHALAYDWDDLPTFVGYDVRSPTRGGLLPPDVAHASFDRLGLTPAPAIERELRSDAFDPDRYAFPVSEWGDTACAGVRLADKHGWRGRLPNPDRPTVPERSFETPEEAADALVTPDLLATVDGDAVETIRNRLARQHRAELSSASIDPSEGAFRSAVAEIVQRNR